MGVLEVTVVNATFTKTKGIRRLTLRSTSKAPLQLTTYLTLLVFSFSPAHWSARKVQVLFKHGKETLGSLLLVLFGGISAVADLLSGKTATILPKEKDKSKVCEFGNETIELKLDPASSLEVGAEHHLYALCAVSYNLRTCDLQGRLQRR